MAALLIVGGLALILAGVILFKGRTDETGTAGRKSVRGFFRGAAALGGRADRNTTYFRCFDCSGVLLPLCSLSFSESVFVIT